jgi:hypothetical protein
MTDIRLRNAVEHREPRYGLRAVPEIEYISSSSIPYLNASFAAPDLSLFRGGLGAFAARDSPFIFRFSIFYIRRMREK